MNERERLLYLFQVEATEVEGLKGTLTQESFYFVYYSMLVLLCLPNMESHEV